MIYLNIQQNVLRKSSTSGSYLDFLEMNDRPFQDQDRPFTSRPSQSSEWHSISILKLIKTPYLQLISMS